MAEPRAGHRARRPAVAGARAGGRGGGGLRLQDGLGAAQRLRAGARRRPRLLVGQAVLAALVGGRAARDPARRSRSSTRRRSRSTSSPGRRALEALQWVCAADVDVPVGRCVYTPWLNARGTYEADLTVTRDGPDCFWVVSSSATTVRDLDWLCRHGGVEGGDVTDAFAVLGVMGPASRDLLGRISLRRLVGGRLPVRHEPDRHGGRRPAPGHPDDLRRRARLGADRPGPRRRGGVRRAVRRGRRPRCQQRRLLHDRLAAAGEGVPGLPSRAVARLHPGRGRPGLRHRAEDRQAVPRPRGPRGPTATGWRRAVRDAGWCRSWSRTPPRCSGAASCCSATAAPPARSPAPPGARRSAPRVGLAYLRSEGPVTSDSLSAGRFEVDVAGERFAVRLSLKAPLA